MNLYRDLQDGTLFYPDRAFTELILDLFEEFCDYELVASDHDPDVGEEYDFDNVIDLLYDYDITLVENKYDLLVFHVYDTNTLYTFNPITEEFRHKYKLDDESDLRRMLSESSDEYITPLLSEYITEDLLKQVLDAHTVQILDIFDDGILVLVDNKRHALVKYNFR